MQSQSRHPISIESSKVSNLLQTTFILFEYCPLYLRSSAELESKSRPLDPKDCEGMEEKEEEGAQELLGLSSLINYQF
jgi:hypothetical protein